MATGPIDLTLDSDSDVDGGVVPVPPRTTAPPPSAEPFRPITNLSPRAIAPNPSHAPPPKQQPSYLLSSSDDDDEPPSAPINTPDLDPAAVNARMNQLLARLQRSRSGPAPSAPAPSTSAPQQPASPSHQAASHVPPSPNQQPGTSRAPASAASRDHPPQQPPQKRRRTAGLASLLESPPPSPPHPAPPCPPDDDLPDWPPSSSLDAPLDPLRPTATAAAVAPERPEPAQPPTAAADPSAPAGGLGSSPCSSPEAGPNGGLGSPPDSPAPSVSLGEPERPLTKKEQRALAAAQKAKEKARKQAEKEAEKQRKAAEKEKDRAAKQAARDARKAAEEAGRAASREAREDAARMRGSQSVKEIIVILDTRLETGLRGAIIQQLDNRCVRHRVEALDLPLPCVLWRRQVACRQVHSYANCRRTCLDPLPAQDGTAGEVEVEVPYVLLVAQDCAGFAGELAASGLERILALCRAKGYADCSVGLLCPGLQQWVTLEERRQAPIGRAGGAAISKGAVDRALAAAMVRHPQLRLRTTLNAVEAGEHVGSLSVALASQPYKNHELFLHIFGGKKEKGTAGDMDDHLSGSETARLTAHALTKIRGVAPNAAVGVALQYGSLSRLMAALHDPAKPQAVRKKSLVGLKAPGTSRAVGVATSAKLFTVLTADDPSTLISDK